MREGSCGAVGIINIVLAYKGLRVEIAKGKRRYDRTKYNGVIREERSRIRFTVRRIVTCNL